MKMQFQKLIYAISLLFTSLLIAHPLPNTVVYLNLQSNSTFMTIRIPLQDFEIAFKNKVTKNQNLLFTKYFLKHIKIKDSNYKTWQMEFVDYKIQPTEAAFVGKYDEIEFTLNFIPSKNTNARDFTIYYDAILHEITNHQALLYVNSDWDNGIHQNSQQIGIIALDVPTNKIYPLHISLEKGSIWKGFKSMIALGIKHISEGTDHLMFILVLLLSAPLISSNNKWVKNQSIKATIIKIVKIITAFTIGHSITLIIGSLTTFNLNPKPIEILIAFSILCTALNAIKPIFNAKEVYIACGFGLIHGMAFATLLKELHLDTNKLVLSLLGFNIGIELMQLFVIVLVMPWIVILSTYKIYKYVRVTGALLASIAALAWLCERCTNQSNNIAVFLQNNLQNGLWFIFGLACFTIIITVTQKKDLATK